MDPKRLNALASLERADGQKGPDIYAVGSDGTHTQIDACAVIVDFGDGRDLKVSFGDHLVVSHEQATEDGPFGSLILHPGARNMCSVDVEVIGRTST